MSEDNVVTLAIKACETMRITVKREKHKSIAVVNTNTREDRWELGHVCITFATDHLHCEIKLCGCGMEAICAIKSSFTYRVNPPPPIADIKRSSYKALLSNRIRYWVSGSTRQSIFRF